MALVDSSSGQINLTPPESETRLESELQLLWWLVCFSITPTPSQNPTESAEPLLRGKPRTQMLIPSACETEENCAHLLSFSFVIFRTGICPEEKGVLNSGITSLGFPLLLDLGLTSSYCLGSFSRVVYISNIPIKTLCPSFSCSP